MEQCSILSAKLTVQWPTTIFHFSATAHDCETGLLKSLTSIKLCICTVELLQVSRSQKEHLKLNSFTKICDSRTFCTRELQVLSHTPYVSQKETSNNSKNWICSPILKSLWPKKHITRPMTAPRTENTALIVAPVNSKCNKYLILN